ncbi:MAG: M23 family metallopeptidase [Enterococcus sp.]
MNEKNLTIAAPLQGEWFVETSPKDRIPSHGTNRFGLRYAFDFIQIAPANQKQVTHDKKKLDYYLGGVALNHFYCFGQPVYAPFSGKVVQVKNNTADGTSASWFQGQKTLIRNSLFFDTQRDGFEKIAGNYVILQHSDWLFAAVCHLQKDSIAVKVGQLVTVGAFLGKVGHSGNSTEPHLHFQLMDSDIIESAQGLPFVFEAYERFENHSWIPVTKELPAKGDLVRFKTETN